MYTHKYRTNVAWRSEKLFSHKVKNNVNKKIIQLVIFSYFRSGAAPLECNESSYAENTVLMEIAVWIAS